MYHFVGRIINEIYNAPSPNSIACNHNFLKKIRVYQIENPRFSPVKVVFFSFESLFLILHTNVTFISFSLPPLTHGVRAQVTTSV